MLMMPFNSNRVTMKNVSLPKRHYESEEKNLWKAWRHEIILSGDIQRNWVKFSENVLSLFRLPSSSSLRVRRSSLAGTYTKVEAISIEEHTHDFYIHLSMSTLPSCSFNSIFRYLYIPHLLLAACFQNNITVIERLGTQLFFFHLHLALELMLNCR